MSPKKRLHKLREQLDFATELAREAGEITLRYYRQGVDIELKGDASPVTIADRETEKFLRDRIAARYPDHGILGEEFGETNPGARWRWILDPIDGTKAFITGIPLYTTLIALECNGDSCLGVIHAPAQRETVAAATGYGCYYNGAPCRVSACDSPDEARIHTTDWAALRRKMPRFCDRLLSETKAGYTWADAYGYLLVATGRAEAMLDPQMSLWDIAALKPVLLEAGGSFTDLYGSGSIYTGSALASNGKFHDRLLEWAGEDL